MIGALKKYSNISKAEYMKMDKTDMEKAVSLAGIPKEVHEAIYKIKPDNEYKERMLRARRKNGI